MSSLLHRIALTMVSGSLLLGAAFFPAAMAATQPPDYPAPPFIPPAGHPRVYFMAKALPRLLSNAAKKQNAAAWEAVCHRGRFRRGRIGLFRRRSWCFPAKPSRPQIGKDPAFAWLLRKTGRSAEDPVYAVRQGFSADVPELLSCPGFGKRNRRTTCSGRQQDRPQVNAHLHEFASLAQQRRSISTLYGTGCTWR
jgi:hypothetical protein